MRTALAVVVVLLLTPSVAGTPTPGTPDGTPTTQTPQIVAIYPNPEYRGDPGEFVVLSIPRGERYGILTLTDGETAIEIPAGQSGRIAVATEPVARNLTDVPTLIVDGPFRLANAGEWVALRDGSKELANVTYPRAPEGALYTRTKDGWEWQRIGATSFPVRAFDDTTARLFVLPDSPAAVLRPLRAAERRLWLAAYTLTSKAVVEILCMAQRRGVDVRVLVELEPVSGMSTSGAERLDRLTECGATVQVIGGPRARYAFHHAKYAIADDRVVVLTENWKPSGVGGHSNRGWGVIVQDQDVANALAETFEADASWRDSRSWAAVRQERTFSRTETGANESYPAAATPIQASGVGVEVLLAPENAEGRVVELLNDATQSVKVIQVSVGGPSQPFARALLRAARRGVQVQVLLADAWFVSEQNQELADHLNEIAREDDLPLRVRLVTPRGRFGKIHAKGAIVDGEHVLVGSLNWNNASARRNREVALLLHGQPVASYYTTVFNADWQGGQWRLPVGVPVAAAVVVLAAAAFARRSIEFNPSETEGGLEGLPDIDGLTSN